MKELIGGFIGSLLGTAAGEFVRTGFVVHGRAGFAIFLACIVVGGLLGASAGAEAGKKPEGKP